jgi:hypothetical protein
MLGARVVPIDAELAVGVLPDDSDRKVVDLALVLYAVKGIKVLLGECLVGIGGDRNGDGFVGHGGIPLDGWKPRVTACDDTGHLDRLAEQTSIIPTGCTGSE